MTRVLVVDDDDDIRCLVAMVLEDEGFTVETAGDGVDALEAVTRSMPDVIVLDMKMPRMDGATFAHELRARFHRCPKIVVVTAAESIKRSAAEAEADAAVGKPFDIEVLLEAVRAQACSH